MIEAKSILAILESLEEKDHLKENNDIGEYKPTGFKTKENRKLNNLNVIYSIIFGVLGGIISILVPFKLLIMVWYPFVGGGHLVSAHHILWAALANGFTKNKKTIMLTMSIKGLLEFLFNDPWGLIIIGANLLEGAFLMLGFYLVEKLEEEKTCLGWAIAGGFGNFFQAAFFWILYQRFYLHWILWVITFTFAIVSGIFIIGLLAKSLKNSLIRAGVPTTC
ncbi:MAG: hypothetical protein ACFFAS_18965 [Promethearchaeota archaeon]